MLFVKNSIEKKETHQVSDTDDEVLRISEARYRRLFETAQDGILIIDAASGRIADVNPFLANLLGYAYQDFIGRSLWEFGPFRDIRETKSTFHELLSTGYIRYEHLPMETKDGKCIEVEFVSNLYQVGHEKWIQCNIRDISKRKQTEANRIDLQSQLNENQKTAAIATLAGGIAHKFNNALTVITTALSLLQEEDLDQENYEYYKLMQESADQMTRLTRELSVYAKRDNHRLKTISLNDLVNESLSLFKSIVKPLITIETELPSNLPQIHADRNQILMVIGNILANASEAIEAKGLIQITCHAEMITAEKVKGSDGIVQGAYVNLTIADTGKGMDAEICRRVFEPFFTTHFPGRGLGMAVVYGIVKNHGGRISIESKIDRGTSVRIYLPAIDSREKASMPTPSAIRKARQSVA